MAHDIVIREGNIVDGTGQPSQTGDIAIDGNTITAIGKVAGKGRQEINAQGLAVTPGFIDLHTHLDAQIGWEPEMTSITWHGVTTALLGNCGVTFAPCKPADREFLAGMMETVEDIPKHAIMSGLPWDWESYGEYLDSIERMGPMVNVGGLVGHSATRFYIMGDRAIEEQATESEIEKIVALAGKSIQEGALGFSVNRALGHRLKDGRPIPGTFASHEELLSIAKEVGKQGGLMQTVPHFGDLSNELDLLEEEAKSARVLFSAVAEHADLMDERVTKMRADGLDVTAITVPRSGAGLVGIANNMFAFFWRTASWQELKDKNLDDRLAALEDRETRMKLINEVKNHPDVKDVVNATKRCYPLGDNDRPRYTHARDESLYEMSKKLGEHPVETFINCMRASKGKAYFHMRTFSLSLSRLENMLKTDWAMPGLGDSGAHVSQMIDSGWTSFVLSHWHRDTGVYSIEDAVKRMTGIPAQVLGLRDRGVIACGKRADINVIDIATVAERQPVLVHDFPGGAPRFQQRATGYKATICNGQVILMDDEHTGIRAGAVLRNAG